MEGVKFLINKKELQIQAAGEFLFKLQEAVTCRNTSEVHCCGARRRLTPRRRTTDQRAAVSQLLHPARLPSELYWRHSYQATTTRSIGDWDAAILSDASDQNGPLLGI
ncbi:hypothetical protein CBL_09532 [Carabus blaptoides fortunei]